MTSIVLFFLLTQPCYIDGGLPDPQCTPGQTTNDTIQTICNRRTSTVRSVSPKTKRLVCQMYDTPEDELVEIDHLIPLELGGANSLINLWPQPATPWPGYKEKDLMENVLHRLVCSGKLSLVEAQKEIAKDWVKLYIQLFPSPP